MMRSMALSHSPTPCGRLAPTPSGLLHIGNARSFLAAWLAARAAAGRVVLRIEDIDRERCRPELEAAQIEDLRWLGLDWDEGPDVGGPRGPYRQSECRERYAAALERLRSVGAVFPCVCSRKEIQTAASAPHEGDEQFYPGTCRGKYPSAEAALAESGRAAAWRMRTAPGEQGFQDAVCGHVGTDTHALVGDYVVMRRDGWPAYQLAVVVDDGFQGVTQVVRGADLMHSTARQMELHQLLGQEAPTLWAHLPLVVDGAGLRLAKRRDGLSLVGLRERGVSAERVLGLLARSLGVDGVPDEVRAKDLVAALPNGFRWDGVPKSEWRVPTERL